MHPYRKHQIWRRVVAKFRKYNCKSLKIRSSKSENPDGSCFAGSREGAQAKLIQFLVFAADN